MFLFKWLRRGIFLLILAGVALTAVAASGCGDYVAHEPDSPALGESSGSSDTGGSTGSGSDTGSSSVSFSIGSTTLTTSGNNFSFKSQDSTSYKVTAESSLSAVTVSVNTDIYDKLNSIAALITGESYAVGSTFNMKDCFDTIFYLYQNNLVQSKAAMTSYYSTGTPLLTISFANSEVTFGILVDVSDITT